MACKRIITGIAMFVILIKFTSAQNKSYNVLFIAVDDLNNYVTEKHPGLKTPNLDKFSKTALTFKKAYCAAPVCNPSRIAVLTGKSPVNTGLYELTDAFRNSETAVNSTLLPELFKNNGYTTYWSGKIFHTGKPYETRPVPERMQAMWDDMRGKDGGYGPMATVQNIADTIKRPMWFNYQPWDGPETDFPDVVNGNLTIERLQMKHDSPFFMALGLYRPHDPWTAPRRFFEMYPLESIVVPEVQKNALNELPPVGKQWAERQLNFAELKKINQWKPAMRGYLASISFMDYNIGRVLDALDNSPYKNNTIVVLWSDNGYHMGEKQHFTKQALWEQACQVLAMIRVPGKTKGTSFDQPVNLLDIYPTLIDLCNLPKPSQVLDGESWMPLIEGRNADRERPSITYYLYGSASVRTKEWRYIRYYDGTEELYNEVKDPDEKINLAKDSRHENIIAALSRWLPKTITPTVRSKGHSSTVINKKEK